jgi:hypothetical protein
MSSAIRQADTILRAPAVTHAEAILAAVVFGAQKFLNESDLTGVLEAWLEHLGAATGAGQVRISRTTTRLRASPFGRACARSGSRPAPTPDLRWKCCSTFLTAR